MDNESRGDNDQPLLVPSGDISHLVDSGVQLQKEATSHNIHNVFDDGGYKELLLLTLFDLKKMDRTGDDARDDEGNTYEIKTVARVSSSGKRKTSLSVTTEHTLTTKNLDRYRAVRLWIVAVFDQAHPEAIYQIPPSGLEPYFSSWESKLVKQEALRSTGGAPVHLNNPKIPLGFIQTHGVRLWPASEVSLPPQVVRGLNVADEMLP